MIAVGGLVIALVVGIAVADTCRLTAELWEVLGFPERIHLGEGRATRTQQGRVAVVRDEAGHCILEGLEVANGLLLTLYRLLGDVGTATVALHLVDRAEPVWQFHKMRHHQFVWRNSQPAK